MSETTPLIKAALNLRVGAGFDVYKANGLRVYEYLEYVLTELAAHQDDTSRDFLADLLPWSNAAQKKCSSLKKGSKKI